MEYTFDLTSRKECKIEADDPRQALEACLAQNPGYYADAYVNQDGFCEGIDRCDGCGKHLFEADVAAYDPEQGNSYCEDCVGAVKEDRARYSETAKILQSIYVELGEMIDLDDAEKAATVFNFLKLQGHSAESISCHLQLHGMYMGHVPDLVDALIENGICTH